jgi:hypothetical protein
MLRGGGGRGWELGGGFGLGGEAVWGPAWRKVPYLSNLAGEMEDSSALNLQILATDSTANPSRARDFYMLTISDLPLKHARNQKLLSLQNALNLPRLRNHEPMAYRQLALKGSLYPKVARHLEGALHLGPFSKNRERVVCRTFLSGTVLSPKSHRSKVQRNLAL